LDKNPNKVLVTKLEEVVTGIITASANHEVVIEKSGNIETLSEEKKIIEQYLSGKRKTLPKEYEIYSKEELLEELVSIESKITSEEETIEKTRSTQEVLVSKIMNEINDILSAQHVNPLENIMYKKGLRPTHVDNNDIVVWCIVNNQILSPLPERFLRDKNILQMNSPLRIDTEKSLKSIVDHDALIQKYI
jgi:hypothetical protein